MIGAWHGIGPHRPQHHQRTALTCGVPARAPWANQGCAAGFLAEGRLAMSEQTFEERVSALEERLVEKTAEEVLAEAEQFLAEGNKLLASSALTRAKLKRGH